MENELKVNINTPGYAEVYTGEAKKVFNSAALNYNGNINAPAAFFNARKETDNSISTSNASFDFYECILVVNHKSSTLTLICGENQQNKITVIGQLKINKEIQEIGINQPSTRRSVAELRDWIKYNRKFLHPECNFQETLKALQKVNVAFTTKKQIEKDGTGNTFDMNQIKVDELPEFNIIFNIRLFEGMPKEKIPVKVEAEVVAGELKFLFFSDEISTLIESQSENLLSAEIDSFGDSIAIIHQ